MAPIRKTGNLSFKNPLLKRMQRTDATVYYLFRAPTVLPRQYRTPGPPIENNPNLLLTLLAAAVATTPFVPEDWTRPAISRAARPVDLVQNLLLMLYPTTLAPFVPEDWPAPRYVASRAMEQAQTLAGLYLPLGKPFVSQDWPAVPQRRSPVSEAVQNLLLTVLAPTAQAAPFIPEDWTVAPRQVSRQSEALQNLLLSLLPTTAAPFIAETWDIVHVQTRRIWDAYTNLLTTTLAPVVGAAPFTPFDWTIAARTTLRTMEPASTNTLLTLLPLTPAPLHVSDWTQPVPRSIRHADTTTNLLLSTLAPAVANMPFVSTDWLVQRPALTRVMEPSQNLLLTVLPTTLAPLRSVEWARPTPVQSRPADASQNLLLTTLAPPAVTTPFVSVDWSRPTRMMWRQPEAPPNLLLTVLPTTMRPISNYLWIVPPRSYARYDRHVEPNLPLTVFSLIPPPTLNLILLAAIYGTAPTALSCMGSAPTLDHLSGTVHTIQHPMGSA